MKRLTGLFFLGMLTIVFLASAVQAQEKVAKPADARELLNKVVAYAKSEGCEKTFNEINKGTIFKIYKNAYVSANSFTGTTFANARVPAVIGQNVISIRDSDGNLFVKNSLEKRQKNYNDNSVTEYKWLDSKTKKIETRSLIGHGFSCGGKFGEISLSVTYDGKM